ncbi:MAG: energy transducer TonB [Gammaproteobacteria bacterium]
MKQALTLSILLHLALLAGGWSTMDRPPQPAGQALTLTLLSTPAREGQTGHLPRHSGNESTPAKEQPLRQADNKDEQRKADQPRRSSKYATSSAPRPSSPPPPAPAMAAVASTPPMPPAQPRKPARAMRQQTPGTTAGGAASGSQLRTALQTALAPHFHYPALARRHGWQGTVELAVHVAADGRLDRIRVIRGSGHAILDKAARRALQQINHLPSTQKRLPGAGLEMILPVEYRLVDS